MERPTEKVIAYSVYGTSKLYLQGALECLDFNEKYMPKWHTEFYVARNCPVLNALYKQENKGRCSVIEMPESGYVPGSTINVSEHANEFHTNMLYRVESLFNGNRIVKLSDTDSRSSSREFDAIEEWLATDYPACAIYDNPSHVSCLVMPGLSAWDTRIISQIYSDYDDYRAKEKRYRQWYSTEGYKIGLRFVHYDIHHLRDLFISPIGLDRIWCAGYNQPNPLRTPMPADGSCGAHLGATVKDKEWRYELYE